MKYFLFLSLFFSYGCATKYILPGNRFITPESQGGAFKGQIEYQKTGANHLTVNGENGSADDGVLYSDVQRLGFLFSNSLFNQFDLVWSHTGGGNSMLGGKLQIIGASRSEKGAGHKAALGMLLGGNEHETQTKSIEFELTGKEYIFLYGYRINESIFPYASLSLSSYTFTGVIRQGSLNGQKPNMTTDSRAFSTGVEFSLDALFAKLETTYQQLQTTNTKEKTRFAFGFSVGYSW